MQNRAKHKFEFYGEGLPAIDLHELQGRLIVIEGPDGVGRSTQIAMLKPWLESNGHAVLDTGLTRSELAGKGIDQAKEGHTLGKQAVTVFFGTDLAYRLDNDIVTS